MTAITDDTGEVKERYATDPFGGNARVFDDAGELVEKLVFTPAVATPGGSENPNPFEGYGNGAAIIAQTTLGTTHDWDTLSSNLGKSDGVTGMYLGTAAVYNPSFNSIATDSGSGGLSFNAITGYVGSSPTANSSSADNGGGWSWGGIYSAITGAYNWYTSSNFITNGQRAMWLGNQMKGLSGWATDYASNSNNILSARFGAMLAYGADFAGSTVHSVGGILRAVEDPLGTAMGIYGQYQSYSAIGIGAWDASVLMFNPLTGVAGERNRDGSYLS